MKVKSLLVLLSVLILSGNAFADSSTGDDDSSADGSIDSSSVQQQQQQQKQDNEARINAIKGCSSLVPTTGMTADALVKVKKCLTDNNGYMPKQYQFTPEETKPIQSTQQDVQQSAPQPQVSTSTAQPQNVPSGEDNTNENLGPDYLR